MPITIPTYPVDSRRKDRGRPKERIEHTSEKRKRLFRTPGKSAVLVGPLPPRHHRQRVGCLLVEAGQGWAGAAVDAVQAGGVAGGGDFVAGAGAKQRVRQVVPAALGPQAFVDG
jgi:hypothetical protein